MNPSTDVPFLNNHPNLIISPAETYDFRCSYCYRDHAKNNGMRPEAAEGIRKGMSFRAPQLKELIKEKFGGEPLPGYDIMLDLMQYAQILGKKNKGKG
jgi:sulfatase maturation enzyme AslB (radical SAM superfamily)